MCGQAFPHTPGSRPGEHAARGTGGPEGKEEPVCRVVAPIPQLLLKMMLYVALHLAHLVVLGGGTKSVSTYCLVLLNSKY